MAAPAQPTGTPTPQATAPVPANKKNQQLIHLQKPINKAAGNQTPKNNKKSAEKS